MTICKPDHLTTRHVWTIQIPDLSGIQMVTLFESHHIFRSNANFDFPAKFQVKFHGRRKNDPPHYCGQCEEEVFNVILIRENETPHVVHCLQCSRKNQSDLRGWICLEEYPLDELCQVYDDFQLAGPSSSNSITDLSLKKDSDVTGSLMPLEKKEEIKEEKKEN